MSARHRLTAPRLEALEARSVPAVVSAGFNDAAGLNANPTADSPYKFNEPVAGRGVGEPGWSTPWIQATGGTEFTVVQSTTVAEGDGALYMFGGTIQVKRLLANPATVGVVTVSQMVYVPPGGGVTIYLQDSVPINPDVSVAGQVSLGSDSTIEYVDSGLWNSTGIPVPVGEWFRIDVEMNMTIREYNLVINGTRYDPPDPIGFRGTPNMLDQCQYLINSGPGVYLDAIQASTEAVPIPDSYDATEDTTRTVPAPGVLGNDAGITGFTVAELVTPPAHAAAFQLGTNGSFTYTPAANYFGPDSFTYRLVTGSTVSDPVTVTLTVAPVNDLPVAADDQFDLGFASPFVASVPGVVGNDSDVENDPVTAAVVAQPAVGTVTLNANGTFSYAFPEDLVGSVSFTYRLSDAGGAGNVATVTLTREGLVNVTGGVASVVASGGGDVLRVRPAGKGVALETQSADGFFRQLLLPNGAPRLTNLVVFLGAGDDRLDATTVAVPVRVVGAGGADVLRTGKKNDVVFGGATDGTGPGADFIETGAGNDTVTGGPGGAYIDAGAGNDLVTLIGGSNWVEGGAGNDVLVGGTGADALFGGGGKDLIAGGAGADLLEGGGGTDILFDGSVAVIDPGSNSLTKVLAAFAPAKRPTLVAITGQLAVPPDTGATDTLTGGGGTDWFWSSDLTDVLDQVGTEPNNGQF